MSKLKISALFPYKPGIRERDFIWAAVRQRYERLFPQIELCIGTDESDPFCRSHAVNEAAKQATGDILMLVDTDVVFNPGLIDRITAAIREHPWLIPFKTGKKLTREATRHLLEHGLPRDLKVEKEDIEKIISSPGPFINVMTRECFETIRGLDERFKGWGREDEAMVMALDTLCGKHLRTEGSVYHLWHHRQKVNPLNSEANQQLYLQYRAAKGNVPEMQKIINQALN